MKKRRNIPHSNNHDEQLIDSTLTIWRELERPFKNVRGMTISPVWVSGVGDRMGGKRIAKMENRRIAKRLSTLLEPLTLSQLVYLRERSAINLRMASDATRLFLVANISAPLGLMIVINQLAPTFFQRLLQSLPIVAFMAAVLAAITLLAITAWYAYAGLHQARDLNRLLMDAVARRQLVVSNADIDQQLGDDGPDGDPDEEPFGDMDSISDTDISAFNS